MTAIMMMLFTLIFPQQEYSNVIIMVSHINMHFSYTPPLSSFFFFFMYLLVSWFVTIMIVIVMIIQFVSEEMRMNMLDQFGPSGAQWGATKML